MNGAKPCRLLSLLGIIAIAFSLVALFMRHEKAEVALARVELYTASLNALSATAAELHRSLGDRPVSAEQRKMADELRGKLHEIAIVHQRIADSIKASESGTPGPGVTDEARTRRVLYDTFGGDAVKIWDIVALISGGLGIAFLVEGSRLRWMLQRRATAKS